MEVINMLTEFLKFGAANSDFCVLHLGEMDLTFFTVAHIGAVLCI